MMTPSKMVSGILAVFLSFTFAISSNAAVFVPSTFFSMNGGNTYCQNAAASNISFLYQTCSSGGGGNTGRAVSIAWYYNTTNSTTVAGATLASTVAGTTTTNPGGTFTYTPSTTVPGTYYYFAVVTFNGTGTCNTSGTLAATSTTLVTVKGNPVAISGNRAVCSGSTTQLSDVAIGTWATGSNAIASVSTTGLVTGGTAGTTTITFANGCGTAQTASVVVTAVPGAITNIPSFLCPAGTVTLGNTAAGGTWSSNNIPVASVGNTSGLVTAGTAGTATITYANGCGSPTATINVRAVPTAISGNLNICVSTTTQLSEAATGGTWTSAAPAVASIGVTTGFVTGGATAGNTGITYNNGCGTANATVNVIAPDAGTITGANDVCIGSSTALIDAVAGGTWSSSNPSAATVNASGMVFGVAPGSTVISYGTNNGCGAAVATFTVTASNPATVGPIIGPSNMCAGTFTVISDAVAGGVWSASNANATVTSTGLLTAVTPGTVTISYTITNGCGPVAATKLVTIFPVLNAGTISGLNHVCPGGTAQLSDDFSGGAWSSTNPAVATISGTGLVTGVSGGVVTISYLMISGCGSQAATYAFTVTPTPNAGTIIAPSYICAGSFTPLSDNGAAGGVWSSSNSAVATIDVNGVVSANTAGGTTIGYTYTNACGTASTTHTMTVTLAPNAGTISGPTAVCELNSIQLSDNAPGGVWSSSSTQVSVSGTGSVTGVSAGTAVVTYTSTTACATSFVTTAITVNAQPATAPISGANAVCVGSIITLSNELAGGTWIAGDATKASVDNSGNVTGVNVGVTSITYIRTNGCGTLGTQHTVTVNAVPVVAPISGSGDVCLNSSVTLSDATPGGLWSNSNVNVTIVSTPGGLVVTGAGVGTATISYAVTNMSGCTTTVVITENINNLPVVPAITGNAFVCTGATSVLSNSVAGGVWTSDNNAVATIDPSTGVVSGVTAGTFNVSYTVTNISGCSTTVTFADMVNTIPAATATTGNTTICQGEITTLANTAIGGTWSNTTGNATVNSTGDVIGVNPGNDYIIYTVTNVCGARLDSAAVQVNPIAPISPITAMYTSLCLGTSVALNDAVTGGVWFSNNTSVATVDAVSGMVTAVGVGGAGISYTTTNGFGCTNTAFIGIGVGPVMSNVAITPGAAATLCHGNPVALQAVSSATIFAYQWTTNGTPIPGATNAVYVANTAATYGVIADNGTCTGIVGGTVVSLAPNPVISYTALNTLYTGSFAAYQWFMNGTAIAGATTSVLHVSNSGSYTVVVADGNNCTDTSAAYALTPVTGVANAGNIAEVKIYPNPAASVLNIDAPAKVNVAIMSMDGKLLISQKEATQVDIHGLANGMYMIILTDENNAIIKTAKFSKAE